MKILAFTPWGSMVGGANRSFYMVLKELKNEYHHEITVIVPSEGELTDRLTSCGIKWVVVKSRIVGVVLRCEAKDILRKIKSNLFACFEKMTAKRLSKELSVQDYNLVYINCINIFLGYFVAKALKLPFVWHLRGALTANHYFVHYQKRVFNDKTGKFIVISNSMYQQLPEILGIEQSSMCMINNGLELKNQMPSKQDFSSTIRCLICGRICEGKGQMEAICAIKSLRSMGFNIELHVTGIAPGGEKDPYFLRLKRYCSETNIQDVVFFEGQVEDMQSFRSKMNIELVCSVCEPFGRCTVEAMQSRLIVIGANTGGTLDIVQDGYNGILYTQGDVQDLIEKIRYVMTHQEAALTIADCAYEFSKEHFTVGENVRKINEVIEGSANYR